MLQTIKKNVDVLEAMLYFWQATSEREKVAEVFFYDVAKMDAFKIAYDEEFNEESVRKVLSAIKNRELPSSGSKKEKRFWNNNMWMMEDLEYVNLMIKPLKKLNLDYLVDILNEKVPQNKYDTLEVVFSPLHLDEYFIKENKLIINFFRVKPSDIDDNTFIGEKELKLYIEEKLIELLK